MPDTRKGVNEFQRRLWNLHPAFFNVTDQITNPHEVIVLPIPVEAFMPGAVAFNQFNKESDIGYLYMLALQSILYSCFKMETIAKRKQAAIERIAQYRLELVYSDDEIDPKLLQYRVWIFVTNNIVTVGEGLEEMIQDNHELHYQYHDPVSWEGMSKKRRADSIPNPDAYMEHLYPHEYYRVIHDKEKWCHMICDPYIGTNRTSLQLDSITKLTSKLGDRTNPANPANVFNAVDCILFKTPKNAHPMQKEYSNYRRQTASDGTTIYTFPKLPEVIQNGKSEKLLHTIIFWSVSPLDFCSKWRPEHQLKKIHGILQQVGDELPGLRYIWQNEMESANEQRSDQSVLTAADIMKRNELLELENIHNHPVEGEVPYNPKDNLNSSIELIKGFMRERSIQTYYISDMNLFRKEQIATLEKHEAMITDAEEYAAWYKKFEDDSFAEFKARCWTNESDISSMGHLIRTWGNRPEHRNRTISHKKSDPRLSVFGNMIIRDMLYLDVFCAVSSQHERILLSMYAMLDAYRQTMDLHMNIINTGDAGTSKSYTFDILEQASIPKTVTIVSHETTRSHNIDEDTNDTIICMHEIPRSMTVTTMGGNNEQLNAFKERLTRLTVTTISFRFDEFTGKRKQVTSVSECIGTYFGNQNEGTSTMDKATRSRFFINSYTSAKRPQKSIVSLMFAAKAMKGVLLAKKEEFFFEKRMLQYRYFIVEKLIFTKALPEFDYSTAQIYFNKFADLAREKGLKIHPRDVERMLIMARILSICLGLECLFNIPTGPFYGKPFEIEQLKEIKPFLFAPTEVLEFVIGLFRDQFVNSLEPLILHSVRKMHMENTSSRRFKEQYTSEGQPGEEGDRLPRHDFFAPAIETQDQNFRSPLAIKQKKCDFNYVFLGATYKKSAENIRRFTENEDIQPSENQIIDVLKDLKQRTIVCHPYDKADPKDKEPIQQRDREKTSFAAIIADNTGIYLHYWLIDSENPEEDPIENIVKDMWYHHTRQVSLFLSCVSNIL